MCSYVEIRNVWVAEESLWVSLLSRVPKPFQWWTLCKRSRMASGQQGGGQRMTDCGSGKRASTSQHTSGPSLCIEPWGGLLQDLLEKGGHLQRSFHGSFVSGRTFFSRCCLHMVQSLKSSSVPGQGRKHRLVWEGHHHSCLPAQPTCQWTERAKCSEILGERIVS